jgi:hypothetical protein
MSLDMQQAGRMSCYGFAVPDVTLIPQTEHERDAFVEEEIADYAVQQVHDAGWTRDGALERACAELTPMLNREFAEGGEQGHRLWSAMDSAGSCVGWLWVTPIVDAAPQCVFLEQITVAKTFAGRDMAGRCWQRWRNS